MAEPEVVERVWFGAGAGARLARAALLPAELLFRAAVSARGALYEAGVLASHDLALPAISVGNLTVGGTGKTPVAAWIAGALRAHGARPAGVLRGYGGDEPLVHELLNPGIPVVVNADRVEGVAEARRRGAEIAVLDDAFQHRRARRTADVVLVSADRWTGAVRLLPAGPWREPLRALRRASLVLVTRKAAPAEAAARLLDRLSRAAPAVPGVVAHLAPGELRRVGGEERSRAVGSLAGCRVLAIAAVGDPASFERQLAAAGARVSLAAYADHHAYGEADVAALAARAAVHDAVVCTLKDAVKLAPLWPRAAPALWYVSQRLELERGAAELDALVAAMTRARPPHLQPAG